MYTLLVIFLYLASSVAAFTVSGPQTVTTGQDAAITWTRGIFDASSFGLRLRDNGKGNDNGPITNVDSRGQKNGQASINFPTAGTYIIEVVTSSIFGQFILASSSRIQAVDPPSAPQTTAQPTTTPTTQVTTQPDPGPTITTTTTSQPTITTTTTNLPDSGSSSDSPDNNSGSSSTSSDSSGSSSSGTSTGTVAGGVAAESSGTAGATSAGSQLGTSKQQVSSNANPGDVINATGVGSSTSDSNATQTGTSSTASTLTAKSKTPIIVGSIVGVLLFFLLLLLLVFLARRRRKRRTETFHRDLMVRNGPAMTFTEEAAPATVPVAEKVPFPSEPPALYEDTDVYDAAYTGTYETNFPPQTEPEPQLFYTSPNMGSYAFPAPPTGSPISAVYPGRAPFASSSSLGLAPPRTDRQMELHDKIVNLQAKLIAMQSWRDSINSFELGEPSEAAAIKDQITLLEGMMQSSWALGLTNVAPDGYDH